jgi:phospholipid/cholesterol/gamma-HCH transport system substrate-binding protein
LDPERSVQVRTGIFTLAVLAALATVVLFLTQEGGLFTPRYRLYAHFDNIEGLTVNGPVWLAGNNVGRVSAITFLAPDAEKAIRVELDLDSRIQHRIRLDSVAMIGTIGLLGDKYIEISLGSEGTGALGRDEVIGTVETPTFAELAAQGRELLENMVQITDSTQRMVVRFERDMGTESLASTVGAIQRLVQEVEHGSGLLHQVIYDDAGSETLVALSETAGSLRDILREIEEGQGPLHQLIYAPQGQQSTLASVSEAATHLDSVLGKIDEGEGTLGALVNDPSLYEELRLLASGARESALLRTLINFVREDGEPE